VTSNNAFSDWAELFHDPIIATAILERLLHHSAVINIKGNGYRLDVAPLKDTSAKTN